jgi:hypothetical protein
MLRERGTCLPQLSRMVTKNLEIIAFIAKNAAMTYEL